MSTKAKKSKSNLQSVTIPKPDTRRDTTSGSPKTPKTPKTPADEGIDFFESAFKQGEEPIHVYELQLDADGGPNKDRSVESLSFNTMPDRLL